MAHFELGHEEAPSASETAELAGKLKTAGYLVDQGELEEQVGLKLVKDETQPQGAFPAFNKLLNKAGEDRPDARPAVDEKNADLLAAFAKDTTAAGKAVAELLQDPTPEAAKALLDRLPSLLPDDPEMASVIAEAMAEEFGDQIVKNKTDAHGNEHDNGNGQFTEKGAGGGDIHTPDEEKRIAEYKGSTDKTAIAWLDNIMSLDEKSQKEEFFKFGSSDAKMSSDIEKVTGIKTEGWPIKMQGNHAVHIIQRHGPTGQHDHSMADKNDFGRIGFAVSHYDKIVKIDDNNGYRDSHNQPAKQIEFRTRIDGTMAVQTVVPDTKKKTLFITSARIEKRKDEHL